jgi:hypothetical protein
MEHDKYCEQLDAFDSCSCSFRVLAEKQEPENQLLNDDFCLESVTIEDAFIVFVPKKTERREDFEF